MKQPFAERTWKLAHGKEVILGPQAVIMGILNVTPDSFSDGGKFEKPFQAIHRAVEMKNEGAVIIDIGGESTKPGAEPVSEQEEQDRVMLVIEALSGEKEIILSVDTYRASTAKMAIEAGCHIINDVWGFQKDPEIANVAKELGAGCVAMHTGRERTKKEDVIEDQREFLNQSIKVMKGAGIEDEYIVLDPGFGFAKDPEENITLLSRFDELLDFGYPLLAGTSRKRFIGHFTGQNENSRDIGTAATSVVARMKGCHVFRVHDVSSNRDALAIADAALKHEIRMR